MAQLAAARQGTHSTKTRGEVRGGGKKPYRQKGTGRARQGSTRAPQFAGGGVVHGPHPRDYSQRTPKKMKAAALRGALSDRARNGRVHVLSSLVEGDTPSTKSAIAALEALGDRRNLLVVLERGDDVTWKSLRNLDRVHVLSVDQLNTYDVLVSRRRGLHLGLAQALPGRQRPRARARPRVATESRGRGRALRPSPRSRSAPGRPRRPPPRRPPRRPTAPTAPRAPTRSRPRRQRPRRLPAKKAADSRAGHRRRTPK